MPFNLVAAMASFMFELHCHDYDHELDDSDDDYDGRRSRTFSVCYQILLRASKHFSLFCLSKILRLSSFLVLPFLHGSALFLVLFEYKYFTFFDDNVYGSR